MHSGTIGAVRGAPAGAASPRNIEAAVQRQIERDNLDELIAAAEAEHGSGHQRGDRRPASDSGACRDEQPDTRRSPLVLGPSGRQKDSRRQYHGTVVTMWLGSGRHCHAVRQNGCLVVKCDRVAEPRLSKRGIIAGLATWGRCRVCVVGGGGAFCGAFSRPLAMAARVWAGSMMSSTSRVRRRRGVHEASE